MASFVRYVNILQILITGYSGQYCSESELRYPFLDLRTELTQNFLLLHSYVPPGERHYCCFVGADYLYRKV